MDELMNGVERVRNFVYETAPARVIFGNGAIQKTAEEIESLRVGRALIICSPGRERMAERIADLIGKKSCGILPKAVQHVPVETVNDALRAVEELQADSMVAVGGGSAIGLAKAIALRKGIPILAVPTTYAGSEMTPIWGITENGLKMTGKHEMVKPKVVIYDPELTLTLPPRLAVTSGMNAVAHCVEGLYSDGANPVVSWMAEEGIRAIFSSLPVMSEDASNAGARSDAVYGTWLGGTVLGSVGMALHHKLCHVLGGSFNLPHAETHTVVLPYVIKYNEEWIPTAMQAMARAMQTAQHEVAGTVFDLPRSLGAPSSLQQLGMAEDDLDTAAELATQNPYYNPRPVDKAAIRRLLEFAYYGIRPRTDDRF